MSLITRCPACGTMFKVVPDQLKVSQGWVRCGHCADVFDASLNMQSAPIATASSQTTPSPSPFFPAPEPVSELPPAPSPEYAPVFTSPVHAQVDHSSPDADADVAVDAATIVKPDQTWGLPSGDVSTTDAITSLPENLESEQSDLPKSSRSQDADSEAYDFDPAAWKRQYSALDQVGALRRTSGGQTQRLSPEELAAEATAGFTVGADAHEAVSDEATADQAVADFSQVAPVSDAGTSPPAEANTATRTDTNLLMAATRADTVDQFAPDGADDEQTLNERNDVSFVRQARRQAFWRKPAIRVASVLAALVLLAALLFQVVFQQRDAIAATKPQLAPWLHAMCARLGCEIGQLRQIESVVIDSSTFNRMGPDAYRLGFSIKNTGSRPLAMPALEVTLTDTQERTLVRRVLLPGQFGAGSSPLQPGADFSGSVAMRVSADDLEMAVPGPLPVTGYRVLAFYP